MKSNLLPRRWQASVGLVLLLTLVGCSQPDRPVAQTHPAPSDQSEDDSAKAPQRPTRTEPAQTGEPRTGSVPAPDKQPNSDAARDADQKVSPENPLGARANSLESAPPATPSAPAQPTPPADPPEPSAEAAAAEPPGFLREAEEELPFPFEIPSNWKRLSEKEEIWIDAQEKLVAVSGRICLTQGLLEMFACPKGTKEHESIVATKPWAMYIHQALLLAGINPGRPVQWEPEYKPAEGPRMQIEVWYFNEQQELVKKNSKDMVRLVSDGSPLKFDWVFGGSKFITDPDGRELYAANGGELICLSNFSSAMIDLPIPSTAEAGGLLFEANPEQIPPLNTPVMLVLKALPESTDSAPGPGGTADKGN